VAYSLDAESKIINLLAANETLIVHTADGITAYTASTGRPVWELSGAFTEVFCNAGMVLTLDSGSTLTAWNSRDGLPVWSRENVVRSIAFGQRIYLWNGTEFLILDTASGALLYKTFMPAPKHKLLVQQDTIYEITEKEIVPIYGPATQSWKSDAVIVSAAADSYGFVITTKDSLVTLFPDMTGMSKIALPESGATVSGIDGASVTLCDGSSATY
jgi:hypothetical protein